MTVSRPIKWKWKHVLNDYHETDNSTSKMLPNLQLEKQPCVGEST